MTNRLIRLRRPPVLQFADGPFVPDSVRLEEVEWRWAALCDENPAYFDGRLYHVIGVHRNGYGGAVMHVVDCAYRFHAVQDEAFDLGIRSLGVKGITVRDGRVLMGRRSQHVGACRGQWECAPCGVLEPGREPAAAVRDELREEAGLAAARDPIPIALAYDAVVRTWEIVFTVVPSDDDPGPRTDEYDELRWCEAHDLPAELSPITRFLLPLIRDQIAR
jgi:8-oxo-dGTP pyrophosphatase MutT (NUDIX family)